MSESIKPGDVVKLASGGPVMTVQWAGAPTSRLVPTPAGWLCMWFDGTTAKSETFAAEGLELVKR